MNMQGLDKNPEVSKLLVHLYDAHKCYNLTKDERPQIREQLAHATAELLTHDMSPKETDLLSDLMIGLIRQAEKDLRIALADKLSAMPDVPLRIILHLANDDISIASPVLKKSPVLNDVDLLYIIKSQGADYWQAIAARETLRAEVVNALAETKDIGTAVVLSRNERIVLTHYATNILVELGKTHDSVARPLVMREEIPESIVRELYNHVSQDMKDYINAFYGGRTHHDDTIDDLVIDFLEAPKDPFMPTDEMMHEFTEKARFGHLSMDVMMERLNHDDIPSFIGMFSVYTGISAHRIHGFLKKSCPKGMAIACRAFGVQKNDFSRMFLMTNRMRSRNRIIDHKDLMRTLNYFDTIRPEVAKRIVSREVSTV